jgi:hypothetical protein
MAPPAPDLRAVLAPHVAFQFMDRRLRPTLKASMRLFHASQANRSACLRASAARSAAAGSIAVDHLPMRERMRRGTMDRQAAKR